MNELNEIKEKYLPVGTVVLLKNGKKRVMITGFCVTPQGKDEVYDYSGCLYPEGFLSSNQNCLFNHSQIEKVFHMGLIDEEEINFKNQLKSLIDMADQFSKFKTTDQNNGETSTRDMNTEVEGKEENVSDTNINLNEEIKEENVSDANINLNEEIKEESTASFDNVDISDIEEENDISKEVDDKVSTTENDGNNSMSFNIDDNDKVEFSPKTSHKVEIETLDDFIG